MTKMAHINEFDKNAHSYGKYNIIQTQVAKELVAMVAHKPRKIVDLGCGSGAIYNQIDWDIDEFVAVDKSEKMLALHPSEKVTKIHSSIEEFDFENYKEYFFISSSALQWCQEIEKIFDNLQNKQFALAIFTANTFKSLHQYAQTTSPILSKKTITDAFKQNLHQGNIETKQYQLSFASTLAMLRYIKKSGVSGGGKRLSYGQVKQIINSHHNHNLEFEVIFLYNCAQK